MPRKVKRSKISTVTQKVVVNVSKSGGGRRKASGPPQPSQAQQLLQTLAPLLTQRQQLIPSYQPLLPSQQQLQSLMIPGPQGPAGPQGPQGPAGPPGERGSPFHFETLSNRSTIDSGSSTPFRTPSIYASSDSSLASLPSFAFQPFVAGETFSKSARDYVADLPDSPLLLPPQPAISAGPIRLDNPHEDSPLEMAGNLVDKLKDIRKLAKPPGDGKEEEQPLSPYEIPSIQRITRAFLEQSPNTSSQKTSKVTLRQIAKNYNIPVPATLRTKEAMVDYLWDMIQNRQI